MVAVVEELGPRRLRQMKPGLFQRLSALPWVRTLARKVIGLLIAGLLLGWVYDVASPKVFPPGTQAGFWLGVAHGGIMPMALPVLLVGKDVPIYQEHNTGRFYKLGYIAGINLCGLIFFGLAFWSPSPPKVSVLTIDTPST